MHDFSCWNPDEMNYELLRKATRYYKESPEGVELMCKAFEDLRNETLEKANLNSIRSLMNTMKLSAEQAMAALKIPVEERVKYLAKL